MSKVYVIDECRHGFADPHGSPDGYCDGGEHKQIEGPVFTLGKGDTWLVLAALQDEELIQLWP